MVFIFFESFSSTFSPGQIVTKTLPRGDKVSRTVSKMDEKVFFDSNPHQRVVV